MRWHDAKPPLKRSSLMIRRIRENVPTGSERGGTPQRRDADFREKDTDESVGIKGTQMPTPICRERYSGLGINDDAASFAAARNGSGK
jgi:hypothetical protein